MKFNIDSVAQVRIFYNENIPSYVYVVLYLDYENKLNDRVKRRDVPSLLNCSGYSFDTVSTISPALAGFIVKRYVPVEEGVN